jgi:hypothetical protein
MGRRLVSFGRRRNHENTSARLALLMALVFFATGVVARAVDVIAIRQTDGHDRGRGLLSTMVGMMPAATQHGMQG